MRKTMDWAVLLFSVFFIVSCGGGGDGGGVTPLTGVLTDSHVSGVDYTCSSGGGGTTNGKGEFTCNAGDTVSFSLAGYVLGMAPVASKITVFDLNAAGQPTHRQMGQYIRGLLGNSGDLPALKSFNTAILLQSLDEDGNPNNGISISATTSAALRTATYSLRLGAPANEFAGLLKKIFLQGGITLPVKDALNTVHHLVDSGVIGTPMSRPASITKTEGISSETTTYTWDANGNMTKSVRTGGVQDESIAFEYDGAHRIVSEIADTNIDMQIDRVVYTAYDQNGNPTNVETSYDDEIIDTISGYSYDAYGNQLERTETDVASSATYVSNKYFYDEMGNQFRGEQYYSTGAIFNEYEISYNESGQKSKSQRDGNNDGVWDEFIYFTHDANGREVMVEYDSDGDGIIDRNNVYEYDESGNLLSGTGYDKNVITYKTLYERDSYGNATKISMDWNGDGLFDRVESLTYDGNNNIVKSEVDSNGDGNVDAVNGYIYNADGYLISEGHDTDNDGVYDRSVTYTQEASFGYHDYRYEVWYAGLIN